MAKATKYRVTELADPPKTLSQVRVGFEFEGWREGNSNRVYFTDRAGCEWVFFIGDTCEVVEDPVLHPDHV